MAGACRFAKIFPAFFFLLWFFHFSCLKPARAAAEGDFSRYLPLGHPAYDYLDRLQERNNYRAALISFESKLRSLALTLDTYKDKIDRGLRTLEQRRLNFLDRQTSLQVAQRRVEMNQILLEAGRVQIRDLREAQDALIAAQNNLTSTAVSYLEARLQVLLDMGILQTDVDKFWLKDPLKQYKFEKGLGIPPLRMPQDRVLPPDQFLEAKP